MQTTFLMFINKLSSRKRLLSNLNKGYYNKLSQGDNNSLRESLLHYNFIYQLALIFSEIFYSSEDINQTLWRNKAVIVHHNSAIIECRCHKINLIQERSTVAKRKSLWFNKIRDNQEIITDVTFINCKLVPRQTRT